MPARAGAPRESDGGRSARWSWAVTGGLGVRGCRVEASRSGDVIWWSFFRLLAGDGAAAAAAVLLGILLLDGLPSLLLFLALLLLAEVDAARVPGVVPPVRRSRVARVEEVEYDSTRRRVGDASVAFNDVVSRRFASVSRLSRCARRVSRRASAWHVTERDPRHGASVGMEPPRGRAFDSRSTPRPTWRASTGDTGRTARASRNTRASASRRR